MVTANHSKIAKPRAALFLKNSLHPKGAYHKTNSTGSVEGSCLTLSPVPCGCWVGASWEHMARLALYWSDSGASESS